MGQSKHYQIFRNGSRTYFHSSLFFPPEVRKDVFILYAFVRQADDFVDSIPQQKQEFKAFCDRWKCAAEGCITGDVVIDGFAGLAALKQFDCEWIDAFLSSMRADLSKSRYETQVELDQYLYGSAEVIGLMMARILDLPEKSFPYARLLGRSMQYINFIRDIAEDLTLGRVYFPQEYVRRCGLSGLEESDARAAPEQFRFFIRQQIAQYYRWQVEGERGYRFIPYRYLIPIRTAAEMYKWTATLIARDPFVIYRTFVRPSISRIIMRILYNSVHIPLCRIQLPGAPRYEI